MPGSSNSWTSIQRLDLEAQHRVMLRSDVNVSTMLLASFCHLETRDLDHFLEIYLGMSCSSCH